MRRKSKMLLGFLITSACAEHAPLPAQSAASAPAAPIAPIAQRATATKPPEPPAPSGASAEADLAYSSGLVARGGRFETDRQIGELKRAILLYTQFLERADGRPELLPAVHKARERIEDANATIIFLEQPESNEDCLRP